MTHKQPSPDMGQSVSDEMVEAAVQGMLEYEGKTGTHYRHIYQRLARAALEAAERLRAPVGGDGKTDMEILSEEMERQVVTSPNPTRPVTSLDYVAAALAAIARVREQNSASTVLANEPFTEGRGAAKVASKPVLAGDGKTDRKILAEELKNAGFPFEAASLMNPNIHVGDAIPLRKLEAILSAMARVRCVIPDGWRPIETAPKDGSEVLLTGPKSDGSFYRETCKWYAPGKMGAGCWPVIWMDGCSEPTHWMPLPAAPALPIAKGETP